MTATLASILFKDYRRKVLELLLNRPDESFHVREIARLTGTVAGTLHRELSTLAEAGILIKASKGHQVFYSANKDCPVFAELSALLRKVSPSEPIQNNMLNNSILGKFKKQILQLAEKNGVTNVRVFGSFARNEQGPDSDLDLLVDLKPGRTGLDLGGFLMDVSEIMHRKVDVVTDKALHPKIREQVLQEAISL